MFEVHNKNNRRCHWPGSALFIINFEHISSLFLMFQLLTLKKVNVTFIDSIHVLEWIKVYFEKLLFWISIESQVHPLQFSVAFYVETSHLICFANQMTGFSIKCNTGLKLVKGIIYIWLGSKYKFAAIFNSTQKELENYSKGFLSCTILW